MGDTNAAERAKRFVPVVETNIDDRFAVSMLLQQFGCTICSGFILEQIEAGIVRKGA